MYLNIPLTSLKPEYLQSQNLTYCTNLIAIFNSVVSKGEFSFFFKIPFANVK